MERSSAKTIMTVVVAAVVVGFIALIGAGALQSIWRTRAVIGAASPELTTKYQAVFMDNGQVYFGQMSGLGTQFLLLTDVYYVQQQFDPKTKVGPFQLFFNAASISGARGSSPMAA